MVFHPRGSRLTEYAVGGLSDQHTGRIKQHLARCARCRRTVSAVRKLLHDCADQPDTVPPPALLDRILRAAESGWDVILPVADPPLRVSSARAFAWLTLVLVGVASVVATTLWVSELRADRSELLFAEPHLLPGREVAVTYRGTSLFHDEDRLVLRARYRTVDDEPYNRAGRHVIAGELRRVGRSAFEGTARLPDEAVYAVFTVEDAAGRVVDSNRQTFWELLLQEGKHPAFDALLQRINDHSGRSWQVAYETTQLMTALYPDNPNSWGHRVAFEQLVYPAGLTDSLQAAYRARFDELDRRWTLHEHVPADVLAGMFLFASSLEWLESEDAEKWKRRLLKEAPRNAVAVGYAVLDVRNRDNPKQYFVDLDELWARVGPHRTIAMVAYLMAVRTENQAQLLRWADRFEAMDPLEGLQIAVRLSTFPASRELGIRGLRRQLQLLEVDSEANRPLGRTVNWHRQQKDARRREILGALGQALMVKGDREAGLLALELAVENTWNVPAFGNLASARLAVGDTLGATDVTAAVVVDPTTPPAVRDSLTRAALDLVDQPSWMAMVRAARASMYAHVLRNAVAIRVPSGVRVYDLRGQRRSWHDLVTGRVTVVGTFFRYGPALGRVTRVHEALTRAFGDRVQMIGLSADISSAVDAASPSQLDAPFPVVENPSGELREVLNWWGIPSFFVLDATGLVRFARSGDGDVLRQVATLLALEEQSIVADNPAGPDQP